MNPPDPPLADAMRRIEDAFGEGERARGAPSADAVRAAEYHDRAIKHA